jgi:hypothetical protein
MRTGAQTPCSCTRRHQMLPRSPSPEASRNTHQAVAVVRQQSHVPPSVASTLMRPPALTAAAAARDRWIWEWRLSVAPLLLRPLTRLRQLEGFEPLSPAVGRLAQYPQPPLPLAAAAAAVMLPPTLSLREQLRREMPEWHCIQTPLA